MFGPLVRQSKVLFVSQSSISSGAIASYGLRSRVEAVKGCRTVTKRDMRFNDLCPDMKVDPESYVVEADGKVCTAEPADTLPLSQAYFVF
jgi:urease